MRGHVYFPNGTNGDSGLTKWLSPLHCDSALGPPLTPSGFYNLVNHTPPGQQWRLLTRHLKCSLEAVPLSQRRAERETKGSRSRLIQDEKKKTKQNSFLKLSK